ncbi:hypothetical protein D4764_0159450 [Takifugu flavidus]|uniref:Uncharacterized protein n=1 Tax=Takifugu flavidus TaxID=433684 RepID=A0A5C6MJD9_9TELE|nr:hypothetical protein D4764_0159450 [Takifugu flavidus]
MSGDFKEKEDSIEALPREECEETSGDSYVSPADRCEPSRGPCLGSRDAQRTRVGGVSWQQREEAQQRLDEQRGTTVQPGDKVFVKVFRRKWFDERRQGPYEVAQSEVTPRAQPHPLENSVEYEAGGQENPEGPHQVEDVVAAVEPPSTGSHQNFLQELLRKSQWGKTKAELDPQPEVQPERRRADHNQKIKVCMSVCSLDLGERPRCMWT